MAIRHRLPAVTVPVVMSPVPETAQQASDSAILARNVGTGIRTWKGSRTLRMSDGFFDFSFVVFGKPGAGTILFRSPAIRVELNKVTDFTTTPA